MLGFNVSEATVSRYLHSRGRRPGQSWQTLLRNQTMVFGHREYAEQRLRGDAGLHIESYWTQLKRSGAAQIATATLWVGLRRGVAQPQPTLNVGRISLRSAQCGRGVTRRAGSVCGDSRRTPYSRSGAAFPIRSPPQQAWACHCCDHGRHKTPGVSAETHQISSLRSGLGLTPRTHQPRNESSRRALASPRARIRF